MFRFCPPSGTPPSAEKTPAANINESPGKKGKNTTPVSIKTTKNNGVKTPTGPRIAIQPKITDLGSFSKVTKKLKMLAKISIFISFVHKKWAKTLIRGLLWLLHFWPDQVQSVLPP